MADDPKPADAPVPDPAAVAAAPAPDPAAAAPDPAAAAETPPNADTAAAAAVDPSAAAAPQEDAAVTAAKELATAAPTLLEQIGEDGKAKEAAPAAPAADPATPAAEAAPTPDPSAAPAAEPVAEPAAPPPAVNYGELYELPPTITMSEEQRGAFHGALDAIQAGNHKDAIGQLIGLYEQGMSAYAAGELDRQHEAFAHMREGWRNSLNDDPVFGGAGRQQALELAARARNAIISDHAPGTAGFAADLEAFNGLDHALGLGDHPVFLRALHRLGKRLAEPSIDSTPVQTGRPANAGTTGHPLYTHDSSIAVNGSGRQ